jgi:glycosyltransferase involved in cell wall biosynthesis
VTPDVVELFTELRPIVERVPADLGGGCPLAKAFLMAYLALTFELKTYVEIGVYRGRSFFPMAHACKKLGGMAYGIDAYDCETAKEYDLDGARGARVNAFLESLDFGRLHDEVNGLRDELGLREGTEIIRETSRAAAAALARRRIRIDVLHIDGNHDTQRVMEDIELYVPLVNDGGLIVLDDTDWPSVRPGLKNLRRKLSTVFNDGRFAVLGKAMPEKRCSPPVRQRFEILHSMVQNLERKRTLHETTVSVIVLSYNQEKYVGECLEGILGQKGEFGIELVIGDDCSTDATPLVIGRYLEALRHDDIEVKWLRAERNLGVTRNLQRCLEACTGQYIAICEGDDYWISDRKLQTQVELLKARPECALSFNEIYIYTQATDDFSEFEYQREIDGEVLTMRELVRGYFIGNISCCVYDAQYMRSLPAGLFDLFIGDWMFNICYAEFGDIARVRAKMSVYRRHEGGIWSAKPLPERAKVLHGLIGEYNRFLNFDFDREFWIHQRREAATFAGEAYREACDVAIIDNVFPHPLSAFRMQEFESYLKDMDGVKIYVTGVSRPALGEERVEDLVAQFKRRHPEYGERVEMLDEYTVINARLMYVVFLENTYRNIERIEKLGVPFVFTLYPGGWFGLDNEQSDGYLRRVTSSPGFRRVIVTQRITYEYLIRKGFCRPEQIEFVFGVVTPLEATEREYGEKRHFGRDKKTLDICFVAHKYVERGIDKGYDVFVEVARELCRKYEDVRFHVVGGFGEDEIDVSDIADRMRFYGRRDMKWFEEFYRDKDIILCPNVPSMIFAGSFDGFPTGACVDAGLRKTAVFAADVLGLNTHFVDGEDIVIVPHDADGIVRIIERYYRDPEKLRALAERGARAATRLYGYDAQMAPRIRVLTEELERAARTEEKREVARRARGRVEAVVGAGVLGVTVRVWRWCPGRVQRRIRGGIGRLRSHEALFALVKRVCPAAVIRFYRKLKESEGAR